MNKGKYKVGILDMRKGMALAIALVAIAGTFMLINVKADTTPLTIVGYVYDTDGTTPVVGATVYIRDQDTGAWGINQTNSSGMFTVDMVIKNNAPWAYWFDGDLLLGKAYDGSRTGSNSIYINKTQMAAWGGYLWLNFTLGTPETTKTVGDPQFTKYNYDDGTANYGYLVSPEIHLDSPVPMLSFWTWWQIEGVNSSTHDLMNVYISTTGGYLDGTEILIDTLNPLTDPGGDETTYYGSSGFNTPPGWVYHEYFLTAYSGENVTVIFEFDTNGTDYNYWEGWYIDDINIGGFGDDVEDSSAIPPYMGNWTYTGYWHVTDHRSHTPGHSWYYGIEHNYVTSQTPFNMTAAGGYNNITYHVWWNGTWGDWTNYTGNFTLDNECKHYLEFYAENGTNSEPVRNQTHYVDDTPPIYELVYDIPNQTINGFPATNCSNGVWFYINDTGGPCESGAEWFNYSVWWNATGPSGWVKIADVSVHDNDAADLDKRVGYITVHLTFEEECYHELIWEITDYVGNNATYDRDIAVDCSPPILEKEIGEPHVADTPYGEYQWLTNRTPIWLNATDVGCGGGAGIKEVGYEIWWKRNCTNESEAWNTTRYPVVIVQDNGPGDNDPTVGNISVNLTFQYECCHEIHFWAIDNVGNEVWKKQKHWVDITPPAIRKDIPKIDALNQTIANEYVTVTSGDRQSFLAPFSYIDAISVYLCGTFEEMYEPYIMLYEDNFTSSNPVAYGYLAEPVPVNETGYFCGWLQFHLEERLYTTHGGRYWLEVVSTGGPPFNWHGNNSNPYADGNSTIGNVYNDTWDFTFKIEYYPYYRYYSPYRYSLYSEEKGPVGISNVAIFKDADPWSNGFSPFTYDPTELILTAHGIPYTVFNSSDIGVVDLSSYDKVIISSDQNDTFYDAVEANLSWFEAYAAGGGQLEIHAADNAWWGGNWSVMPGGFTHDESFYDTVDIAMPDHPVLEAPHIITDGELDNWFYSSHGYFLDGLPAGSEVILTTSNEPVFVISPWGNGTIMISTQPLEWGYYFDYSPLLENVVLYCPLYELHNTWITYNATLMLSSWDEGCMDGVGLDTLLYRIYYNDSTGYAWHPTGYDDNYCGNHNITYVDDKYWYVAINDTVEFLNIRFHEGCEHILQMRAEDFLGNVRIVNQTHFVDDDPPTLEVEYPPVHGFYYDPVEDKQYVRAGRTFYLNLSDNPECGVGWRDFTFYWRYEYTNFTTPYIEEHPANDSDHEYPGELVNISGHWWWKITPGEPSVALTFNRECMHTIYYFYNASDWLDNEISTEVETEVIYVDENYPELEKTHPVCYYEEEPTYWHTPWNPLNPVVGPLETSIWPMHPYEEQSYTVTSWHDGFTPWRGGKALVLYYNTTTGDGWVQYDYKDDTSFMTTFQEFRDNFAEEGWSVDFATHVNASLLAQYDALFILTPVKDIPNSESQAIIEWVREGGQLVITQNEGENYANEIASEFGITFNTPEHEYTGLVTEFAPDLLTMYPNSINELNVTWYNNITVTSPARPLGWNTSSRENCILAINEHAGRGMVIAMGEEYMWEDSHFENYDNEELMDNILYRFYKHCVHQVQPCHYIDMIEGRGDGEPEWYHVDDMTITLYLHNWTHVGEGTYNRWKYIEFKDGYDYIDYAMFNPNNTAWMEVWETFSINYTLVNWTDTDHNGYLSGGDVINLTGSDYVWTIEEVSLDLVLSPVPYIQACGRINLTAVDMPDILKLVDQYQNLGDRADELQPLDNISYWPWDAQTFMVSENVSAVNEVWLWLNWTGPANLTVYIHNTTPFNPGLELGKSELSITGQGEGWVKFIFDPPVNVTPGETYFIDVHREKQAPPFVSWAHTRSDEYPYGQATISGTSEPESDWKFAIVAYRPNPCASGIEGIYYAYEYNDTYHPTSMSDNTTVYGTVVNITDYYSDAEIDAYFGGHELWYVYDEAIGVHFHEACNHTLYYWTKDNVCHHTRVYKQVYHVDDDEPYVLKEHPKHGYYTPLEVFVEWPFEGVNYGTNGTFYVNNTWWYDAWDGNGWIPDPSDPQYINKSQNITFNFTNNDVNNDSIVTLYIEEWIGDKGITLQQGSDVNNNYDNPDVIVVPAGSSIQYDVMVYDYYPHLRFGLWNWSVDVENVTNYLRAGAKINLTAYDPGLCASGIQGIYWRYEWNGTEYPQPDETFRVINGSEFAKYGYPENITGYRWYIYNDTDDIVFHEECRHDLYYFAKDRTCHRTPIHHQVYHVDGSAPVVTEDLPEHGAIGTATQTLYEDFEQPFGNGWATVGNTGSGWNIKTNGTLYNSVIDVAHSGRYSAIAWRGTGPTSADAWLITPRITIPTDGNLSFWYRNYDQGKVSFEVMVNNQSANQTQTAAFTAIWDSGTFSDTTYRKAEVDISAYAGQDVYIAFHFDYSSGRFNPPGQRCALVIDDVWIGGIHRIAQPFFDDMENETISATNWFIDDLTAPGSFWFADTRIPVYNTSSPAPAFWCGDLSLGNAPNGFGLYGCNWNDTLTLKTPMDLSGLNASTDTVTLDFTTWFTLGPSDSIYVEVSIDGENWTAIDSRTGVNSTGWETRNLDLSSYIGNATVYLRFRFVSDDDDDGWIYNGWYIDNISVYNGTGIAIAPLSFDDCSGFTNWNRIMLETSKWHITDYDAHSENNSWYCGVESTPHYLNCMDDVLVTRQIDLTGYSGYQAMLMFWHMYDMSADGDDNCTVEISADNSTWTELAKYTGSRNWVQEFINISDYIGQQVWIRFRFQSDSSTTDTGWFVDDVLVEIRNITETTFEDDFELYVASPGIPRFPPTGPLNEIGGDWTVSGNFAGDLWYGWDQYGTVVNGRALLEGYLYSGAQDEWLISPVIPDLPKFSNLTFRHRLGIDTAGVSAGIYMKLDGGNWTLLRVLSDTSGSYVTEDVSLWDYHGHDIQLAFVWQTNGNCSYDDRWMIDWINVSSFGFLRVCAPVYINATDLPDNECRVGTSAIYWRYVYEGTHYPGESGDGYSRGEIVYGNEIPGTPDWAIDEYWWRIPDNSQWDLDNRTGYISAEIHFYEDCIHELYYFAKDHVCHSSDLHYERWYVDGTAPETWLGISWGSNGTHPWIPRNGPEPSNWENPTMPPSEGWEEYMYPPESNYPDVICIKDDVHLWANHTGLEPCIYPYNHTDRTYYRYRWWNPDTEKYEFWPTPETPGAINGSNITVSSNDEYIQFNNHSDFWVPGLHLNDTDWAANWSKYIENYYGGYVWWMPYTEPFYFTEGCNHTLYYFSKDDLCNTERPNEWYVGVDDMAPEADEDDVLEFELSNGCLYYDEFKDIYYFQDCSWLWINSSDMPENTDCRTGIWYIDYSVQKWESNETEIRVFRKTLPTSYDPLDVYIGSSLKGNATDAVDNDGDGNLSVGDYIKIDFDSSAGYGDGWYRITEMTFDGLFRLTIQDVFGGAGQWVDLLPWSRVYSDGSSCPPSGVNYKVGDEANWMALGIHLGDLNGEEDNCGKYEVHWIIYDYNNMTLGERKQDFAIDCTPPKTTKEFSEPVLEGEGGAGEVIHWVNPETTKIWLNGTDPFDWDSGIKEVWYQFWSEEPILLWKLDTPVFEQPYYPGVYSTSKHWFTINEAAQIMGYTDASDYFAHDPDVNESQCIVELRHWSVDRVCHEEIDHHKQHIYVDGTPPVSRVDEIVPYEREETPFNITVVDIQDFGCGEDSGPVGVCKVEVYYLYDADNESWGDSWVLYATNTTLITHPDGTADNWTLSFDAPEGGGYYRFKSIAYDCLGNVEQPPFYHGTYDAECEVIKDRVPPVVTKVDGEPSYPKPAGEESIYVLKWDTPIYVTVVDQPDPDNASGVDELYITFEVPGPGTHWEPISKTEWTVNDPGVNGYYNISYTFILDDYKDIPEFSLEEGVLYHMYIKAIDAQGNEVEVKAQKFVVDETGPVTDVSVDCTHAMPFNVTVYATDAHAGVHTVTLYFRYSAEEDGGGDRSWSEWMVYDTYEWTTYENATSHVFSFIWNPDDGYYKPGYYEFYAYAEDNLGNSNGIPINETTAQAECYVEPIEEDFNGDGMVNVLDLYYIIANWGKNESSPDWATVQIYDLSGNGVIDALDIYALVAKWTG